MGIRQKMITEKNSDVSPKEVANLRESVVWNRNEEIYPEVLMRHSAYFTSRNSAGKLIGYVSVLSDALREPAFRKKYPNRGKMIPEIMFIAAQTFYKHGQFGL